MNNETEVCANCQFYNDLQECQVCKRETCSRCRNRGVCVNCQQGLEKQVRFSSCECGAEYVQILYRTDNGWKKYNENCFRCVSGNNLIPKYKKRDLLFILTGTTLV